jgi:hypothetical protein
MHNISSAIEAAQSGGRDVSFDLVVATCRQVLIVFEILTVPKTGEN